VNKNSFFISLFFLFLISGNAFSQQTIDSASIFGVTIDDSYSNIPEIKEALAGHCIKPTARIVFKEFVSPADYKELLTQIKPDSYIMGQLLDSYYVKNYSVKQYTDRAKEYYNALGNLVDIWEIGNEINGDWLEKNDGNIDSVVAMLQGTYDIIKPTGKKTAITFYFNRACYSSSKYEMFTWINDKLSSSIKQGLDYALVSYYEDDCKNTILTQNEWQQVFDSLHVIFPNAKLGMGECGTTAAEKKAEYIERYYKMKITTPGYIGGYFWWHYKQDCVPKTKSLWNVLDNAIKPKWD
jgi:hypothetical protein